MEEKEVQGQYIQSIYLQRLTLSKTSGQGRVGEGPSLEPPSLHSVSLCFSKPLQNDWCSTLLSSSEDKKDSSLAKSESSQIIVPIPFLTHVVAHLASQRAANLLPGEWPLLGRNAFMPSPFSLQRLFHRSAPLLFPFHMLPLPSLRKECYILQACCQASQF